MGFEGHFSDCLVWQSEKAPATKEAVAEKEYLAQPGEEESQPRNQKQPQRKLGRFSLREGLGFEPIQKHPARAECFW